MLLNMANGMQSIDASGNLLSGALPATTFEGVWLESVDYSVNNLTGSIANNVTSYAMEVSQAVQKCIQVYMGLHALLNASMQFKFA